MYDTRCVFWAKIFNISRQGYFQNGPFLRLGKNALNALLGTEMHQDEDKTAFCLRRPQDLKKDWDKWAPRSKRRSFAAKTRGLDEAAGWRPRRYTAGSSSLKAFYAAAFLSTARQWRASRKLGLYLNTPIYLTIRILLSLHLVKYAKDWYFESIWLWKRTNQWTTCSKEGPG